MTVGKGAYSRPFPITQDAPTDKKAVCLPKREQKMFWQTFC
jgi:hypothetical protein